MVELGRTHNTCFTHKGFKFSSQQFCIHMIRCLLADNFKEFFLYWLFLSWHDTVLEPWDATPDFHYVSLCEIAYKFGKAKVQTQLEWRAFWKIEKKLVKIYISHKWSELSPPRSCLDQGCSQRLRGYGECVNVTSMPWSEVTANYRWSGSYNNRYCKSPNPNEKNCCVCMERQKCTDTGCEAKGRLYL